MCPFLRLWNEGTKNLYSFSVSGVFFFSLGSASAVTVDSLLRKYHSSHPKPIQLAQDVLQHHFISHPLVIYTRCLPLVLFEQ